MTDTSVQYYDGGTELLYDTSEHTPSNSYKITCNDVDKYGDNGSYWYQYYKSWDISDLHLEKNPYVTMEQSILQSNGGSRSAKIYLATTDHGANAIYANGIIKGKSLSYKYLWNDCYYHYYYNSGYTTRFDLYKVRIYVIKGWGFQ